MPILSTFYDATAAGDIHLLRGERSRDLRVESLAFRHLAADGSGTASWAKTYLDAHTGAQEDVKLEFRPTFRAALVGDEWQGFGIKVNRLTGEVSFDPGPAPSPAPANFIIEAVITQNTGGLAPDKIEPSLIRVHVHPAATRMWLTPSSLTVRRLTASGEDRTRYRFTVRAEFSDGIVGDLTVRHNVTWSPAANVYDGAGLAEQGLLRVPAGVAAGASVPITATWSSFAGTLTASANMVVAAPWSTDPTMPKADLVDGSPDTWKGTVKPEVVPNVLFFGDGFSADPADRTAFESIANKISHDLKTDRLTRPYDVLATSMNYWRVFVPSASRGISVRCEVFTRVMGGKLMARTVPPALKPPAAGAWGIEHLIYAVGLPMPTDVAPAGEAAAAATARRTALRARWAAIARTAPTVATVSDALIEQWARIGTRTFVDEIDAFPAMGLGGRPAADNSSTVPFLALHDDRGGAAGLDGFYRALRASNNVALSGAGSDALGILWAEDRADCRFDNRSLVVVLSAVKGGRAQRTSRHIDISLETSNADIPVIAAAGRQAVTLDASSPLPTTVDRDVWRVMSHELGHSFGLGDEYVDLPGSFVAPESTLDQWGNLTSEAAVVTGGRFSSALVKWNWRRVAKAATLVGPIAPPAGTEFDIKVELGQAFQFMAGDKVRLRERTHKQVLRRDPFECSSELVVVSRSAAGDVLRVRGSPNPVELARFGSGSVVYIAVPLPGGGAGEARLIAPKVAKYIDDNNRPLTPWPVDPAAQIGVDAEGRLRGSLTQVPAYDGHDGGWSHRNDARVVGLYSGGSRFGAGIFHPTGTCMMRNSHSDSSAFCAVCRFVMVDLIDPQQHWWIDRDYDKVYPK
jgi:hypothetical protein